MEKIDKNKKIFFYLIKAGLWEKEVQLLPFGEIDFAEVQKLAEEQSIVGLIAAGINKIKKLNANNDLNVPKVLALQLVGQTLQLEQRNKTMNAFIASLVKKMQTAGICTLLVKGQGVAQCYERPLWRTCGDIDLFLSDDNYKKALAFLPPLASTVEKEYEGSKHLGMTIDGWVVELHGSLRVGLPYRINRVLDDIKRDTFYGGNVRSWDNGGTQIFMLGKENDIVYVFVHFFNHFYKEGVGLRQICDWCRLLWTYRESIDKQLIERRIKQMGLMSEWKAFAAYAVEYLGMPIEAMPMYSPEKKWVQKAQRINKFILNVGNMGHNRDMSHFSKYPYVIRKCVSMGRRVGDLANHARIFPLDSLRFFPNIMLNGLRSAARGE